MSVFIVRCLLCGKVEPHQPSHLALSLNRNYHGGTQPVRPQSVRPSDPSLEFVCHLCVERMTKLLMSHCIPRDNDWTSAT